MQKIFLNFFNEKVKIDMPNNLKSLRKSIEEQFLFSPLDSSEFLLKYIKDYRTKFIINENDFLLFTHENINEIIIDISQKSRIYQQNINEIENNNNIINNEIDILIKEKEKIIELNNKEQDEGKKQLNELEKQIILLQKEYKTLNDNLIIKNQNNIQLIIEKDIKINQLKKKVTINENKYLKVEKEELINENKNIFRNEISNEKNIKENFFQIDGNKILELNEEKKPKIPLNQYIKQLNEKFNEYYEKSKEDLKKEEK